MATRTVEIEDNLNEIIEGVQDEIKELAIDYIKENNEKPDMGDLDYSGSVHEIIDGAVPIYTGEIEGLFYLYGNDFEESFDNAGIGDKNDEHWPSGWKPAAIYCYIEEKVNEWFNENIDDLFDEVSKDDEDKDLSTDFEGND